MYIVYYICDNAFNKELNLFKNVCLKKYSVFILMNAHNKIINLYKNKNGRFFF
jgi:hypothetical protein